MAEPANIDTSTPDPAIATADIEKQKAMLNDLIATEGQAARQLYERQGTEAQQLLNARLGDAGAQPDARKAVYDAFIRDQSAAENQHARTMQRQAAFNSQFMEAAKAAVPIHSKNVDAAIEAMRLQFEERQRREQEAAAARAASSAAANINPLIKAQMQQDEYVAWAKANGKNPDKFTAGLDEIEAFGAGGSRMSLESLADQFNMDINRFYEDNDKAALGAAQGAIEKWVKASKGAVSFTDLGAEIENIAGLMDLSPFAAQMLLLSNAPRWGISPQETGFTNEKVVPTYRKMDPNIGLFGDIGPQASGYATAKGGGSTERSYNPNYPGWMTGHGGR